MAFEFGGHLGGKAGMLQKDGSELGCKVGLLQFDHVGKGACKVVFRHIE